MRLPGVLSLQLHQALLVALMQLFECIAMALVSLSQSSLLTQ
jgi:hypothetical protein